MQVRPENGCRRVLRGHARVVVRRTPFPRIPCIQPHFCSSFLRTNSPSTLPPLETSPLPPETSRHLRSHSKFMYHDRHIVPKIGSLQAFVPNIGPAEDFSYRRFSVSEVSVQCRCACTPFTRPRMHVHGSPRAYDPRPFPPSTTIDHHHHHQVHKIAILDMRLLNCDRNGANLLVRQREKKEKKEKGRSRTRSQTLSGDQGAWDGVAQCEADTLELVSSVLLLRRLHKLT